MKIKLLKNASFNYVCLKSLKIKNARITPVKFKNTIFRQPFLKYLLSVIFYYSLINKKILIVSEILFFKNKLIKFFNKQSYSILPLFFCAPGFFSNKIIVSSILKASSFTKKGKYFFSLKKSSQDLVIFLGKSQNFLFISELSKLRIPALSFKLVHKESINMFFLFLKILTNK